MRNKPMRQIFNFNERLPADREWSLPANNLQTWNGHEAVDAQDVRIIAEWVIVDLDVVSVVPNVEHTL